MNNDAAPGRRVAAIAGQTFDIGWDQGRRAAFLECAEIAEREAERCEKIAEGRAFYREKAVPLREIAARYRQMAEGSGE